MIVTTYLTEFLSGKTSSSLHARTHDRLAEIKARYSGTEPKAPVERVEVTTGQLKPSPLVHAL